MSATLEKLVAFRNAEWDLETARLPCAQCHCFPSSPREVMLDSGASHRVCYCRCHARRVPAGTSEAIDGWDESRVR